MDEVSTLDCKLAYHVVYINICINVAPVWPIACKFFASFLTCSLARHTISVPTPVIVSVDNPYVLNNLANTRTHQSLLVRLVFSASVTICLTWLIPQYCRKRM